MTEARNRRQIRQETPGAPHGTGRLAWIGPGLVWAVAAVGAGELLLTPRVSARFGYSLLWMVPLILVFSWLMVREVGRYTIVDGGSLVDGYGRLPGPRQWAVWLIATTHFVAIILGTAGQAALAGAMVALLLPGSPVLYAAVLLIAGGILIVSGHYAMVERFNHVAVGVLTIAALAAAVSVLSSFGVLADGLVPQIPQNFDFYFVLPWLGFVLVNPIPMFSYWLGARHFAGGILHPSERPVDEQAARDRRDDITRQGRNVEHVHRWFRLVSLTAGAGTLAAAVIIVSFYILGAELLAPRGTIPSGVNVAQDLTRLLTTVWGAIGFWLFAVTAAAGFWSSSIDNADGSGRIVSDATFLISPTLQGPHKSDSASSRNDSRQRSGLSERARGWLGQVQLNRATLRNAYVLVLGTAIPVVLLIVWFQPVTILTIAGIVNAIQTPFVAFLTLWTNRRLLPAEFQPGTLTFVGMLIAGLFYGSASVLYLLSLVGIKPI